MATVQMNVRIDDALKADGDRVLGMMGYNPTYAVRVLWQFLAQNAGNANALNTMMELLQGADRPSLREEKIRLAEDGAGLAQRLLEARGLELRDDYVSLTKDEVRDEALRERFEQKGLL